MATLSVIEVSSTINRNNHEFQIRISDTIGENAEAKLREIRTFLDQAIAEFQNGEAPVEEVTNAQPSSESETNPNPLLPSFDPITGKQLKTLRDLLTKKGVPESDLCKAHGVSRLEDLKKGEGRWIISDLIYK